MFEYVLQDKDYQGLSKQDKQRFWNGMFDKHVAVDPDYVSLAENDKQKVKDGFLRKYLQSEMQSSTVKPMPTMAQVDHKAKLDEHVQDAINPLAPENWKFAAIDKPGYDPLYSEESQAKRKAARANIDKAGYVQEDTSKPYLRAQAEMHSPAALGAQDAFARDVQIAKETKLQAERAKRQDTMQVNFDYTQRKIERQYAELQDLQAREDLNPDEEYRLRFLADRIKFDQSLLPYYQTGMNERTREAYLKAADVLEKNPVWSYPAALALGTASLLASPYTMFTPDGSLSDTLAGYTAGLNAKGSLAGNITRGILYSAPMTIAMVLQPHIGAVLSQTMITSGNIREVYQDGQITDTEAYASVISGALQALVEYGFTSSQIGRVKGAFKNGGEAAASAMVKEGVQEILKPSAKQIGKALLLGGIDEGVEEITQNMTHKMLQLYMLDEPMPSPQDLIKELAIDFIGGFFGGVVFGGIGAPINIHMNNKAFAEIQSLKDSSPAAAYISDAIDSLNQGELQAARKSYRKALFASNLDPAAKQNKSLQRGYALVNDAMNLYEAKLKVESEIAESKKKGDPGTIIVPGTGISTDTNTESGVVPGTGVDTVIDSESDIDPVVGTGVDPVIDNETDIDPVNGTGTNTDIIDDNSDGDVPGAGSDADIIDDDSDGVVPGSVPSGNKGIKIEKDKTGNTKVRIVRPSKNYLLDDVTLPEVDIEYEIVEADTIISSHTEDNLKNTNYPEEMQPRKSRGDAGMALQNDQRAKSVIGEVYAESPLVQQGAPLVGDDNLVDAGNGRANSLKKMYRDHSDTATKYRQYLIDYAKRNGIDPKVIEGMRKPVLIKRRKTKLSREQRIYLAGGSNAGLTDKYTSVEQAESDAAAMGDLQIDLDFNDDGSANWQSDPEFVRSFLQRVIPASEHNSMAPNNNPQAVLITRIINALIIRAYGNNMHSEYLIESVSSATSPVAKNIITALTLIAPKISEIKQRIANGALYDIDISTDLVHAAARYVRAVIGKEPIEFLIDQTEVGVKDELNYLQRQIVKRLYKHRNAPKQLISEIMSFYNYVEEFGNPNQGSLFGDDPVSSAGELYAIVTIEKDMEAHVDKLHELQKAERVVLDKLDDIALSAADEKKLNDRLAGIKQQLKEINDALFTSKKTIKELRSKQAFVREQKLLDLWEQSTDKQVRDALVGMLPKDAVESIVDFNGKIEITFKDGRKLSINLLDNLINVVWRGDNRKAKGQMLPGKTESGKLSAVIDIVRAYNENNLTGYHEGFHLAYYMFLNDEQRNHLQDYYRIIMEKTGNYTVDELNDVELVEEYMADAFADYAANKANTKGKDNLITGIWKALLKRLHNFLRNIGLVSKDISAEEMFSNILAGRYDSKTEIQKTKSLYRLAEDANNEPVGYRIRKEPAPSKTVKTYKAFVEKDGKLYPLFVGANSALPVGKWLDATEGGYRFTGANGRQYVPALTGSNIKVPNEDIRQELFLRGFIGQSANKVAAVAYRPGWHGGTLPIFPQGGKSAKPYSMSGYPYAHIHPDNVVFAEVDFDADKDYKDKYIETAERNKDGSINKNMSGIREIPKGGFYEYETNFTLRNRKDVGTWLISGGMKINRVLSKQEVNDILDKEGIPRQLWESDARELYGAPVKTASKAKQKGKADIRYKLVPENFSKSKQELVNPIDGSLSDQKKVMQLHSLRDASIPVFRAFLDNIKTKLGIKVADDLKDDKKAIDKTHRSDKPDWYSLEHLMDYYRGMAVLKDQMQIIDIIKLVDLYGLGVVEFDYEKTLNPSKWGYRDMNFTLRMPNGLMVEFQCIVQEIADQKPEMHKLYEKWRKFSEEEIIAMGRFDEYEADRQLSYDTYNKAWSSALIVSGMSQSELSNSLMAAFTSSGLVSKKNNSNSSSTVNLLPAIQSPFSNRENGITGVDSDALLPLRSRLNSTFDSSITTSNDNISQISDDATNSQAKSLENNKDKRYRLIDNKIDELIEKHEKALRQVREMQGDPEALAKSISDEKGLDERTVKDKFGRIIKSAQREAADHLTETLQAMGLQSADRWIDTNKPMDKGNLTFHLNQAEEFAQQMGLAKDDYDLLGKDGYTYYIQSLNVFSHVNYLSQLVFDLQQKINNISEIDSVKEQEALLTSYNIALDQLETAWIKYNKMKSNAGRLLRHAREKKGSHLKDMAMGAIEVGKIDRSQIEELNRINNELLSKENELSQLESGPGDIDQINQEIRELMDRKAEMEAELAEMQNKIDHASGQMDKLKEDWNKLNKDLKDIQKRIRDANKKLLEAQNFVPAAEGKIEQLKSEIKQLQDQKESVLNEIKKLNDKLDEVKLKIRTAKSPNDILKILEPSVWDMVKTAYYAHMLSGHVTHIKNMLSTAMNMIADQFVLDIMQPGNIIRSRKEVLSAGKGAVSKAKEAWLLANTNKYDHDPLQYTENKLIKLYTYVFKALSAEDAFLTELSRASRMSSLAWAMSKGDKAKYDALMAEPSAEMLLQVMIESKRSAFNNNPEGLFVGSLYGALEHLRKTIERNSPLGGMAFRSILPFIRVPANVFQSALSWTPFGYIHALGWKYYPTLISQQQGGVYHGKDKMGVEAGGWARKEKVTVNDPSGKAVTKNILSEDNPFAHREAAMQLAKATIGTILMALLFAIGKGIVSGGGARDREKRAQLEKAGWQQYSVKIGDKWISYRDWFPWALPLAIVGNYHDYIEYNGREDEGLAERVGFASMGVSRMVMDRSFLSGLSEMISAMENQDGKWIYRLVTRTAGTFLSPNLFKQIENMIYGRDVYKPETVAQMLIVQTKPYTRMASVLNTVPKRIDMFGDDQKLPGGIWYTLGIPINEKTEILVGGVDLAHIIKKTTDRGVFWTVPKQASIKRKGVNYKLEGKEFELFKRYYGVHLSMIMSERYQSIMDRIDNNSDDELHDYYLAISRIAKTRAINELKQLGIPKGAENNGK